ncbi:hypothetical protein [Pseudomonas sp.]|jgi:hypothetical protein|uniref:hypothetical protein n=1 Tax=Pseudomonas sp. TaxID=306 RepID=UPI0028A815B9|nr:hypothetical protein [Pseudomonas sp.]
MSLDSETPFEAAKHQVARIGVSSIDVESVDAFYATADGYIQALRDFDLITEVQLDQLHAEMREVRIDAVERIEKKLKARSR